MRKRLTEAIDDEIAKVMTDMSKLWGLYDKLADKLKNLQEKKRAARRMSSWMPT